MKTIFSLLLLVWGMGELRAQPTAAQLVPYRQGTKWGYADRRGQLVLPLSYDEAGPFVERAAWVRQGQLYGYIDGGGHPLTPVQYERAGNFANGRATVQLGGETFDIDRNGLRLIEPASRAPEEDFLAQGDAVRQGGKVGFRFSMGSNKVVPALYDELRDLYHDGLLLVRQGTKWGVLNAEGQPTLRPEYDAIRATDANGYVYPVVEQRGRFGYLSHTGTLLTPIKYTAAEPFVAGVARVTTPDGLVGYIDETGREYFDGGGLGAIESSVQLKN
ncbi:WG repeat-containing protein [Hymenobacter koreensis]|uniref:WG repeat-containing protein n=1 Tax=Hymenobacter koreensis TaxID=1084523 RepID=A0ABP8JJ53_9BACT